MKRVASGDVADHPYQTQFEDFFASLDRGVEMAPTAMKSRACAKASEQVFEPRQSTDSPTSREPVAYAPAHQLR